MNDEELLDQLRVSRSVVNGILVDASLLKHALAGGMEIDIRDQEFAEKEFPGFESTLEDACSKTWPILEFLQVALASRNALRQPEGDSYEITWHEYAIHLCQSISRTLKVLSRNHLFVTPSDIDNAFVKLDEMEKITGNMDREFAIAASYLLSSDFNPVHETVEMKTTKNTPKKFPRKIDDRDFLFWLAENYPASNNLNALCKEYASQHMKCTDVKKRAGQLRTMANTYQEHWKPGV